MIVYYNEFGKYLALFRVMFREGFAIKHSVAKLTQNFTQNYRKSSMYAYINYRFKRGNWDKFSPKIS